MGNSHRTAFFDLTINVLLNISSAWFGVALITPIFTKPFISLDNLWLLTQSVGFGMLYFATAYWIKTRKGLA